MSSSSINNAAVAPQTILTVSGLRGSAKSLFAAQQARVQPCCCIVPDEDMVAMVEEDLKLFTTAPVYSYPGYEIPPYTPLSPDPLTTAARLSCLYRLQDHTVADPFILVVSTEALMRRTLPRTILADNAELLLAGEEIDRDELVKKLNKLGYEHTSLVQNVGEYSIRGGIFDIFPPSFFADDKLHTTPLRLDFFGDTIESLRSFTPANQRSTAELAEATILPASDICPSASVQTIATHFSETAKTLHWDKDAFFPIHEKVEADLRFPGMEFFLPLFYPDQQTTTLFDFLPKNCCLIHYDEPLEQQAREMVHERIENNYQEITQQSAPALAPERLFLSPKETNRTMQRFAQVQHDSTTEKGSTHPLSSTNHQILKQDISLKRREQGLIPPLSRQIDLWQEQGDHVFLCCRSQRQTKTIAALLEKHHHQIEFVAAPIRLSTLSHAQNKNILYLCDQPISEGFSLSHKGLHILSEAELFGEMRLGKRRQTPKTTEPTIRFTELSDGDIVVHRDHGLGRYLGISTLELQGITNDFMLIEYKGGDKLYLPVDRLNLISRYEGLTDREPRMDKLGSQSWRTIKSKVKEEVWKVAEELLAIYAKREMRAGRRFQPPGELYHELEESFPYDETEGQEKSITAVISDLTSDKPMDRLVCGDVGYGKTEVAVRAAFKVVEDGAQVAILVPTTVLAEQHLQTFTERMQGFGVNINCINRFRTPAQQKQIVCDLAAGKIDIIIGTHRLLSKDISYHDLGLLIIDEEHRFGVAHKEKIKSIKAEVDILTLTATPIPRTLQMSLLAIRDLSVISSAPEHRRPVKTFVAKYDDLVIKEAVSKEMRRKGQVFFVHNRVKSIYRMASSVQKLVPEARIAVAHGQMSGKELEEIMVRFVNREIDVLMATTIIESGLDIPTANTIVINRADMLGLAEIYQLRGRVGRSSTQSFAYLLVPSLDNLSNDSKDRLRALMDCHELGGGFKLAMSDLQIRGGGNLLGISQSGQIAAIGYDLYLDLLQSTIADLKAQAATTDGRKAASIEQVDPEVNLQLSAYIPESYITDVSQRYIAYRRIASLAKSADEVYDNLLDELTDRYGTPPEETHNLFKIVACKKELAELAITKLEKGKDSFVFSFAEHTPLVPERLLQFLQNAANKKQKITPQKLTPDGRLIVPIPDRKQSIFTALHSVISTLNKLCRQE